MEKPKIHNSLIGILKNKSYDNISKYFENSIIVTTVFRYLPNYEQQIIISLLSLSKIKLFSNEEKLKKSISILHSLGLVYENEKQVYLHPMFRNVMLKQLSFGPNMFYKEYMKNDYAIYDNNNCFFKWISIYNIILKDDSNIKQCTNTNPLISRILNSHGLVYMHSYGLETNKINTKQNEKCLEFILSPLHIQVNLLLLYIFQSFSNDDTSSDSLLLSIIFELSYLKTSSQYIINIIDNQISQLRPFIGELFSLMDSIGLISINYEKTTMNEIVFSPTILIESFLNQPSSKFVQFSNNFILENDFKLYIYSTYDYIRKIISKIIRLIL